jgi:hypothetical protein
MLCAGIAWGGPVSVTTSLELRDRYLVADQM